MPADIIIYALVSVALVFWLKTTLGTRDDGDEPVQNIPPPLPDLKDTEAEAAGFVKDTPSSSDALTDLRAHTDDVIGIETDAAAEGLRAIAKADPDFDVRFFCQAAQDVFVMGVEAFADGDRDALHDILEPSVYTAFDASIAERAARGYVSKSELVGISQARIVEAGLEGPRARIKVRFLAEQTYALYTADGEVVEGDPERAVPMRDIWVFARDVKERDPRWLVEETCGDFEGDNDIIPNA